MNALPDELLLDILERLVATEFERNRYFVWSLGYVSRRFHRLIKAYLYHTYSFQLDNPWSFLRTISDCPDLAKCVKHVTWDHRGCRWPSQSFEEIANIGTPSAIRIPDTNLIFPSQASIWTRTDNESFFYGLILLLPNIETLDYLVTRAWVMDMTWYQSIGYPKLLTNLKNVNLYGTTKVLNLVSLFRVSSIRTLRLEGFWFDGGGAVRECSTCFPEKSSDIEHLHIKRHNGGTRDLLNILRAIRGLKTFDYRKAIIWRGNDTNSDNRLTLDGILSQRNSLRSLHLRDWCKSLSEPSFQVLRQVDHLQFLDIDASGFFGAPVGRASLALRPEFLAPLLGQLPSGLHRLTLLACNTDDRVVASSDAFVDALLAITCTIRQFLPLLTTLTITDWDPLQGVVPCQRQLKALQLAYADIGITFVSRPKDQPSDLDVKYPSTHSESNDFYALDYVEQGWFWIQSIQRSHLKWLKHGLPDLCSITMQLVEDNEWVDVRATGATLRFVSPSTLVMDQYLAEQPLWYWEELRAGRS